MQHLHVNISGYKGNGMDHLTFKLIRIIADEIMKLGVALNNSFDIQVSGSRIVISYHEEEGVETKIHIEVGITRIDGQRNKWNATSPLATQIGQTRTTFVEMKKPGKSILQAIRNLCSQ